MYYIHGAALTADDSFVLGQRYRVHVRLTPVGDWAFSDETPATINGLPAESEGVSMGATLMGSDVFLPDQVYRVTIVLWTVGGWSFTEDTKVRINGMDATYLLAISNRAMFTVDMKCGTPFVDVVEGKYYYLPVLWAYFHDPQITAGTSKTKFSPDATCTRGQIVTFLYRDIAKK